MHLPIIFACCTWAVVLESTSALAVSTQKITSKLSTATKRHTKTATILELLPTHRNHSPFFRDHYLTGSNKYLGLFPEYMLNIRGGSTSLRITKVIEGFLDDVAASRSKSWAVLILSILIETLASTISKRARDTSNALLFFSSVCMNLISICGFCTSLGKIDVGVAYAIWAALGTVIVSTAGIVLFNERTSPIKLISILLVIVGVVGLNLSDTHS